ncbi:MAG: LPS assembly lipoprotein LptE [Lysobacter sp.]
MIRRLLCLTLASTALLALSACGFQLRDALSLPADLDPVKVVSIDRYSPLAESLAESLTRAGAVPATPDVANPAVLGILVERWGDTPISVDERGRAQEFNLRYAVVFELRNGDGTVLVPQQNIELARAYISSPISSIGTESERETLMRELQREMAASILRRIDAAASGGTPVGGSDKVFIELTDAAKAAMEAADAMAPLPKAAETSPRPAGEADMVEPAPVEPDPADPKPADPMPGQPR